MGTFGLCVVCVFIDMEGGQCHFSCCTLTVRFPETEIALRAKKHAKLFQN